METIITNSTRTKDKLLETIIETGRLNIIKNRRGITVNSKSVTTKGVYKYKNKDINTIKQTSITNIGERIILYLSTSNPID
jgi:hypothetical protein